MPEEGAQEEDIAMNRVRQFANCLFFIIPLVLSLSCLVASAYVDVDRGHAGNAPDIIYSDIPKKEYHAVTEGLPCADVDEYDNFVVPILGDNRARQNEPKVDESQEVDVPDVDSDQRGDKKEELEPKKNEDAEENSNSDASVEDDWEGSKADDNKRKDLDSDEQDSASEDVESDESGDEETPSSGNRSDVESDYEVPQEAVEDPRADDQSFDSRDDSDEKPAVKNPSHERIQKPSKLLHKVGNIGHHKVKIKHVEAPEEDLEKLEEEIERMAEGDPQFRESMNRKRNEPLINQKLGLRTLNDNEDESEIVESRKLRHHEIDDKNPPYRETMHRNRNVPQLNGKRELQTDDDDYDKADVSSSNGPSKPKKRLRVLGNRHIWAADESMPPTLSKRDAAIDVDDWGYCGDIGPEKWQDKWPDCGGNAQSPINLDTSTAKIEYEPILKWKGYSNTPSKITLINNGHSVVLTTSYEDCGNRPFIWDSIMNHEYVFGELTFHWGADESSGSEHTVNYLKYPLEMQVVHYRRELGSIEKAQEVPGGIAIVGILYHIEDGKRQNQGIADVQTGFAKVRDGPASTTIQPFPLSRVIPQFSKHYLSYNGSMTTPPCTETVIWLVHLKQATISKKQLAKFHRLKNEGVEIKQNNRPVQKSNKRCVLQIT